MSGLMTALLVLNATLQSPENAINSWQPLKDALDGWLFTENFALTIGNASHGRVFEYERGNMTLHTSVQTASTSKWPVAMMFAGLVQDGTIESFDDPVNRYLDWWTKDKLDNRSYVTLGHLLSFTSGFGGGHPGMTRKGPRSAWLDGLSVDDADCVYTGKGTILDCAKAIYATTNISGRPGTVWAYNGNHLQLAGGLAVAVTGLKIHDVLAKYLFKPYGMRETLCSGGDNPALAVCLKTTGADYESFLSAQLAYTVLDREIVALSERDHTPFMNGYQLYGHYGFGHFLACFDNPVGFTRSCAKAHTHIDPGAFGYYPLLDRKRGYYLNLVAYEHGESYPRSGIPEYLGLAVKPIVDAIMEGQQGLDDLVPHHDPQFLALTLADINYCAGCYLNPNSCL